jgi:hypothetical protein
MLNQISAEQQDLPNRESFSRLLPHWSLSRIHYANLSKVTMKSLKEDVKQLTHCKTWLPVFHNSCSNRASKQVRVRTLQPSMMHIYDTATNICSSLVGVLASNFPNIDNAMHQSLQGCAAACVLRDATLASFPRGDAYRRQRMDSHFYKGTVSLDT